VSGTTITLIGLLIAAVGGIIAFAGQRMSAREDRQRPNPQLEAIARDLVAAREDVARLKRASPGAKSQQETVAAEEKLAAVENRLNSWADNLVESSQSKKAERRQSQLELEAEALRISNKTRPVLQFALDTSRDAINAYNHKAKSKISLQLPALPTDLLSDEVQDYKGTITFSENAIWKISLRSKRPPSPTAQIYLQIAFATSIAQSGSIADAMFIGSFGGEKWFVRGDGDRFAVPERFGISPTEIQPVVEELILRKLEEQLLDQP
jgi:hypothetical protein